MNDNVLKIAQHDKFDINEFRERWSRARLSAIHSSMSTEDTSSHDSCCGGGCQTEESLLQSVPVERRDAVLRSVFDYSRRLGQSVTKYLGMTWEVPDLTDILPHMLIPCFSLQWRAHNDAHVLDRKGCSSLKSLGSFGCDYWREALDGLVMGVGENERLSRHRSMGHGDDSCLDVLFTEVYVAPRVVSAETSCSTSQQTHKYGSVPVEMVQALEPMRKRFKSMKVRTVFEGVSEGILYYRLDAEEGVLCGAGGKLLHDSLISEVAQHYPQLIVKDAAPLAVYGGSS